MDKITEYSTIVISTNKCLIGRNNKYHFFLKKINIPFENIFIYRLLPNHYLFIIVTIMC